MQELMPAPTWGECRTAAGSIGSAELGPEAIGIVRPRGPFGVLRRRGPLALQLYVAARDHLLIWQGPDSLALLQPPAEKISPLAAPGLRLGVLRRLVRGWDTFLFAGPAGLLLAGAGLAALALAAGVGRYAGVIGVLLALAAMIHVALLMSSLVVAALVRTLAGLFRSPSPDAIAAEVLPGRQWTVVLCHHVTDARTRGLLGAIDRQFARILLADVREDALQKGVKVVAAEVTETLVVLQRGGTTRAVRDAIGDWTEQDRIVHDGAEIALRMSQFRPSGVPSRIFESGGFLAWYVGGEIAVLAVLARIVAGWERAACAVACQAHPVTYGSAWHWLLQRLLLSDPFGLGPATRPAWMVGWLVSLMSITGLFVAVAALQQYLRARTAKLAAIMRKAHQMPSHTLIMVATAKEYRAVSEAVQAVTRHEPEETFLAHQVVTRLGTISLTRISLVQVEPGTIGPGAAAIAAAALVTRLEPDFLILTGICYGLRPGPQDFSDVLVCTQLRAIDLRKVAEPRDHVPGEPVRTGAAAAERLATTAPPAGDPTVINRGDQVTPSPMLLGRLRAAARRLDGTPTVHFGPMLTANTLVSSRKLRDELHAAQPDAIGGEMEGAGVYAAAAHAKVDWIVVKGVCDWGFDKIDDFHDAAARNAAALIVQAAEMGGLDEAPARGAI
jgi:nucleoside phosphorylase